MAWFGELDPLVRQALEDERRWNRQEEAAQAKPMLRADEAAMAMAKPAITTPAGRIGVLDFTPPPSPERRVGGRVLDMLAQANWPRHEKAMEYATQTMPFLPAPINLMRAAHIQDARNNAFLKALMAGAGMEKEYEDNALRRWTEENQQRLRSGQLGISNRQMELEEAKLPFERDRLGLERERVEIARKAAEQEEGKQGRLFAHDERMAKLRHLQDTQKALAAQRINFPKQAAEIAAAIATGEKSYDPDTVKLLLDSHRESMNFLRQDSLQAAKELGLAGQPPQVVVRVGPLGDIVVPLQGEMAQLHSPESNVQVGPLSIDRDSLETGRVAKNLEDAATKNRDIQERKKYVAAIKAAVKDDKGKFDTSKYLAEMAARTNLPEGVVKELAKELVGPEGTLSKKDIELLRDMMLSRANILAEFAPEHLRDGQVEIGRYRFSNLKSEKKNEKKKEFYDPKTGMAIIYEGYPAFARWSASPGMSMFSTRGERMSKHLKEAQIIADLLSELQDAGHFSLER
jgi:hypothetical protein